MKHGSIAIAVVEHRVMVVEVARTTKPTDRCLDVFTFIPFGERVFLWSEMPSARISTEDILAVFSPAEMLQANMDGALELPDREYKQFVSFTYAKAAPRCAKLSETPLRRARTFLMKRAENVWERRHEHAWNSRKAKTC